MINSIVVSIYILLVYSPFSDRVGLPPYNIHIPVVVVSTHSHDLASGGSPMFPLVVHQPASLASSAVTPAGSVHKSRGDNVVRMWVQLKR